MLVISPQLGVRSKERCTSGIYTRTTLYVNDLPQMVKQGEVRQYADDTTLSLACKDARDLEEGLTRNVEDVARLVEETG